MSIPFIDPYYLVGVGILFIAIEAFLVSFVTFWFGLSMLVVGGLSIMGIITTGEIQVGVISVLTVLTVILFRKKMLKLLGKSKKEHNDDFLNEPGYGTIQEGKVYFKATLWNIASNETFEEGERVQVTEIKGNDAVIKKVEVQ